MGDLMRWYIPFHLIEHYAAYLDGAEHVFTEESIICNCTPRRIGRECQYELPPVVRSPGELLGNQMNSIGVNSQETLTSFVDGIQCQEGAVLLEWRHICDGIAQCTNGIDDFGCHLLEFHRCADDEFQCRNGMCISTEFAFDAMPDCMDSSDEQELAELEHRYYNCATRPVIDCDDRLCRKDQFSCGNGDCIPWSSVVKGVAGCRNARHAAFLCELSDDLVSRHRQWSGICRQTTPPLPQLTNASSCHSSLRYLLDARTTSPLRKRALENIMLTCPELIMYSDKHVLSPNLKLLYNRSRIELFYKNGSQFQQSIPRTPHLYCFGGQIACEETLPVNFSHDYCIDNNEFEQLLTYPFPPIAHLLCQLAITRTPCHGEKHTNQRSSYQCRNTSDRLSLRRINDGYIDCLYGDDERNDRYAVTVPFRYQCQTVVSPLQYVSYAKLGNSIDECFDGSDELSTELRWSSFVCDTSDKYACWVLQGDRVKETRLKDIRLHFRQYCDSVWNTMHGRDEMNCSLWVCDEGLKRCNQTGQCIQRGYLCDGEFDCSDGEDELHCPVTSRRWNLTRECHIITEFFCITEKYLVDRRLHRPCIPSNRVGDEHIDCIGARDERNVASCPDHRMLGDRFLCDNQTRCVEYTAVCNGVDDCLDRTDELICFWHRSTCPVGHFTCADMRACKERRCSSTDGCSDRSHWLWCPNSTSGQYSYRASKEKSVGDHTKQCNSQSEGQQKRSAMLIPEDVIVNNKAATVPLRYHFCNRGFYLHGSERAEICFCPPTFYGDRCQFSTRRVTARIRFDRWHRSDLPTVLHVLIMLVRNGSDIVDHQFVVDEAKPYPTKHNVYLIYSRPKPSGFYSLRIEAYHTTDLIHFWEYPINPLEFLPVLRIAKILRFPDRALPWRCAHHYCKNNGTCYQREDDQCLCLCPRHWQGRRCEIRADRVHCAARSLARTENICVCPYGYLHPLCFVLNRRCEEVQCLSNEMCAPLSTPPIHRHLCMCNTSDCKSDRPVIAVHRQKSNQLPVLIQLLKLLNGYPTVRQQILIPPWTDFPLARTISTRDYRSEMGGIPEIALLFTFEPSRHSVETALHLLFINCSSAPRNYSVNLDLQLRRCRPLPENLRYSVSSFSRFCANLTYSSCFLSAGYFCYCHNSSVTKGDCLSYQQRHSSCDYCQNHGYCVRGDLTNTSDFACVCPACVTGVLCQFSTSRFSISLEFMLEKTNWGRYNFIGPAVFFLIGVLFNGLGILTFGQRKIRHTGVGLHLLANCIFSQLVLLFFCARVVYLYVTRRIPMTPSMSEDLCRSLPFLMYTFYYISLWLTAFVTVERAAGASQLSYWSTLQKPRTAALLILFVSVITMCSNYLYFYQYQLVNHPDDSFPWCVREVKSSEQSLTQALSLIHQLIPFLINIVAALTIIVAITRSKAHAYRKNTRRVFIDQTWKRMDLLLGPIACFLIQLPEIIILFLNSCDYDATKWFAQVALSTHYLSFTPHFSLFFLYVLPSQTYKDAFAEHTLFGVGALRQNANNQQKKFVRT